MIYGETRKHDRIAARLFQEKFHNRRTPHHSTIASIERRLKKIGNMLLKRSNAGK